MQDAIRYLLPAIPTVLYGGLGRHQVERLAVLRKACERTWEQRALGRHLAVDFASLFPDVAVAVRRAAGRFSLQRQCGTSWWARWPSCWKRTATR